MRAFPSAVLVLVRVPRKGEEERQLLQLLLPRLRVRVGVGVGVDILGAVRVEVLGKGRVWLK